MSNNADQTADLPSKKKKTGMRLRWRLPLMALFFGPVFYSVGEGDYVLAALWGGAGIAAFSGYCIGAVSIFVTLAALTAAIALAPPIGRIHEYRFTEWFGTTGLANRFLSIGVVGFAISLVLSSIVMLLLGKILRRQPRLDTMNRWLGFTIGGLEGLAAMVLFLGGILIVEPLEQERATHRNTPDLRGRAISSMILATAEKVHVSRVGPVLEQYNPFVCVPKLNKIQEVQRSVQVLSDPAKLDGLMQHPSIVQLQQRPEIRQVIQRLNSDPEINNILRSGRPMDRTMATTLLHHPAVLELVDQPDFLEEAAKVIQTTNLLPHGGR